MSHEEQFTPEPISDNLENLAGALIDYALDLLAEAAELSPSLAMEDGHGHQVLMSFDDACVEEAMAGAREHVRAALGDYPEGLTGPVERYAIAYDGAIAQGQDDAYEPALVVEYGEKGMSQGYSCYLLYRNAGQPQEFMWTDPAPAGEGELLV